MVFHWAKILNNCTFERHQVDKELAFMLVLLSTLHLTLLARYLVRLNHMNVKFSLLYKLLMIDTD